MAHQQADHERIERLRLIRCPGIGPVTFRRLLVDYASAAEAVAALPERLRHAGQRPRAIPSRSSIEDEWAATLQLGARVLFSDDEDYPRLLKLIPDAPSAITILGNSTLLSRRSVGVVGARNASAAGLRMAETLAAGLAAAEIVVVSGLALGIDRAAHAAAVYRECTVAALAGGIDTLYPPENQLLRDQIAERGCLITEAPLGTVPQGRHFPRRNRLIAGMSQAVVVVEGGLRSGTLITARMAMDYGRDIFAVPGSPLDPRSRGGNDLIRQGATLTETIDDILQNLSDAEHPTYHETASRTHAHAAKISDASAPFDFTNHEPSTRDPRAQILSLLSNAPISVDDLVEKSQCSVSIVSSALSSLELEGAAQFLPDGQVVTSQPAPEGTC